MGRIDLSMMQKRNERARTRPLRRLRAITADRADLEECRKFLGFSSLAPLKNAFTKNMYIYFSRAKGEDRDFSTMNPLISHNVAGRSIQHSRHVATIGSYTDRPRRGSIGLCRWSQAWIILKDA